MLLENTSGSLGQSVEQRRSHPLEGTVYPGQTVVLKASNSPTLAAALIQVVEAGIRVLVVPDTLKSLQIEAYSREIGACGQLQELNGELSYEPIGGMSQEFTHGETGIYVLSSGSTGAPKTIFRPLSTWQDEGKRYCNYLNLTPSDRVLILSPISHSYGLGFMWGAHIAGAEIDVIPPTNLGAAANRMLSWATHVCVTPNIAKLMALRSRSARKSDSPIPNA